MYTLFKKINVKKNNTLLAALWRSVSKKTLEEGEE